MIKCIVQINFRFFCCIQNFLSFNWWNFICQANLEERNKLAARSFNDHVMLFQAAYDAWKNMILNLVMKYISAIDRTGLRWIRVLVPHYSKIIEIWYSDLNTIWQWSIKCKYKLKKTTYDGFRMVDILMKNSLCLFLHLTFITFNM